MQVCLTPGPVLLGLGWGGAYQCPHYSTFVFFTMFNNSQELADKRGGRRGAVNMRAGHREAV